MAESAIEVVALIGTGIVGRGWMRVFCAAGRRTRVYDRDGEQLKRNLAWFEKGLQEDVEDGLITSRQAREQRALLSAHTEPGQALEGAGYIQESTPERLEVKQAVFAELDKLARPGAIIASSSSGLNIDEMARGLPGASRCILAHPYNPPFVTPVVEVLPSRAGGPELARRTVEFLKSVGQVPVVMNFHLDGFLGNRIQAAVVREAIHLVESGAASVEAVDAVICHGLGLRWALFGNFGVNHTNADGGLREYYARFGESYPRMMDALDSTAPSFDSGMIERIGRGVDEMVGRATVPELCRWRDRLVRKIRVLKEEDPQPGRD